MRSYFLLKILSRIFLIIFAFSKIYGSFKINPSITFNYLGEFYQESSKESSITLSKIGSLPGLGENFVQDSQLEINGEMIGGRISFTISFNKFEFKKENMDKFAGHFKDAVISIIEQVSTEPDEAESEIVSVSSNPYVVFNEKNRNRIFMFPPLIAYGMSYHQFSSYFKDYTFCCFDFIESENRLEIYEKIVKEINPGQPSIFMGYSGGGSFAYHVADHLLKKGVKVSDIIMIDSLTDESVDMSKEEFENEVNSMLDGWNFLFENNPQLRTEAYKKIMAYNDRISTLKLKGSIDANIYLLRSELKLEQFVKNSWKQFTNGQYEEYQCEGIHREMLNEPYIFENAKIIKKILESIFKRK